MEKVGERSPWPSNCSKLILQRSYTPTWSNQMWRDQKLNFACSLSSTRPPRISLTRFPIFLVVCEGAVATMCLYITPFDEDKAKGIRAEEKIYLAEFKVLLHILQEDYVAPGPPLWEYIQGHSGTRMKEHLLSHGELVTLGALCSILCPRIEET